MRRDDDNYDGGLDLGWEEHDEPRRRRGEPPTRQQRRRRQDERRRKGRSWGALTVLLVLLLVLGGGVYWGVGKVQDSQRFKEFVAADYTADEQGEEFAFEVPEGAGGTRIANLLREADVLKSVTAFINICTENKESCEGIQPGRYKVHRRSPAKTTFDVLIDPKNKLVGQFTVVEGLTVIQTLKKLAEQTGIPLADFEKAAQDPAALGVTPDWYTREDGRPSAGTNKPAVALGWAAAIEGFLFPDTYAYDPAAKATDILKMMVTQFMKVANDVGVKPKAATLGLSPYELVIAASIAQDEGKEADFAKVTRVIYNRLFKVKPAMTLGMDSTVNYWLELNGKPTKRSGDLLDAEIHDATNPYNTHDKANLPLGPVSSPGKSALLAAATPTAGNWLYFVATDKVGTTKFAVTYYEHCQNINEAIKNGLGLDPC